jgi:8-oxo-dGTP pyrophosphatase MutT (NUDIX family)
MYKVFCDNRCLNLICMEDESNQLQPVHAIDSLDLKQVRSIINDWLNGKIVFDLAVKTELQPFDFVRIHLPSMKIVEAAGGIVRNADNAVLFIFRNNFWDLPKGHVDPGETHLQTAIREVEEETGIVHIEVKAVCPDTWHFYQMNGFWWMKHTCWFDMQISDNQLLYPQLTEGITKAEWVENERLSDVLQRCYRSVKDVLGPVML